MSGLSLTQHSRDELPTICITTVKGMAMNLNDVRTWLEREHAGFSDIRRLAEQCREASARPSRESAAMLLLAERASAFCERYEEVALATEVVDQFLVRMRNDVHALSDALDQSGERFLGAINMLAAEAAKELAA
jgi:hypothetical protein